MRQKNLIKFGFSVGLRAVVTGWGLTNFTHQIISAKLKMLDVLVVDSNICRRKFPPFGNYHICTRGINNILNEATCRV
jgi:hypothetical protein